MAPSFINAKGRFPYRAYYGMHCKKKNNNNNDKKT
jgi:hypothetical protein